MVLSIILLVADLRRVEQIQPLSAVDPGDKSLRDMAGIGVFVGRDERPLPPVDPIERNGFQKLPALPGGFSRFGWISRGMGKTVVSLPHPDNFRVRPLLDDGLAQIVRDLESTGGQAARDTLGAFSFSRGPTVPGPFGPRLQVDIAIGRVCPQVELSATAGVRAVRPCLHRVKTPVLALLDGASNDRIPLHYSFWSIRHQDASHERIANMAAGDPSRRIEDRQGSIECRQTQPVYIGSSLSASRTLLSWS